MRTGFKRPSIRCNRKAPPACWANMEPVCGAVAATRNTQTGFLGGSVAEPVVVSLGEKAVADDAIKSGHEGGLHAPTRHALGWQEPAFYDATALEKELDRVFDICHGCRRCFNLCNAFPTLFDLNDASKTGEVNGVEKKDYGQVVDQCYLCDMCYMTKCPYVPPHPWNVDFPHLMLRAKAVKHRNGGTHWRDQVLSSTDTVGAIAGIPIVVEAVNAVNKSPWGRKLLDSVLHVHPDAPVPTYVSENGAETTRSSPNRQHCAISRRHGRERWRCLPPATCNRNEPQIGLDLARVFEHNGIEVVLAERETCCGMPKLELGDSASRRAVEGQQHPVLLAMIGRGYDIVAPIPSCVLMFKQEPPLMFPDDADVAKVRCDHMFDPFEYLALRHKAGLLRMDFARSAGQAALPRCLPSSGSEHRPEDP